MLDKRVVSSFFFFGFRCLCLFLFVFYSVWSVFLDLSFVSFFFIVWFLFLSEQSTSTMEKVQGDDAQLAAMGHKAELKRNFSMLYVSRIGVMVCSGR